VSTRSYRFVQWLLRTATRVFFRRIEVVGREILPPAGEAAVIFCGNHPNSLLDPVLITAHSGREVHFAAKDVLFENKLLRVLLDALGAVPVRRRKDHKDGALDNESAFEALHAVLGRGSAVGIFPEGISHDESQLAPLKTGAARIALGASRSHPDTPVYLVPTGLVYLTRNRFRSSVLIQFGDPILITREHVEAEDQRAVARELTDLLEAEIRGLTVNAGDWDTVWVLDGVRRLYQPDELSLEERVELARRFNAVYPEVKHEPDVKTIYARVRDYLVRLSAVGLEERTLRKGLTVTGTVSRVVGHMLLLLTQIPLALIGVPVHLPIGLLLKLVGKRLSPRSDTVATTKFALGLLLILLTYSTIVGLFIWKADIWWGLLAAIILPLSGRAFIHVMHRVDALRHIFLTTARVLVLRKEIEALRKERQALQLAVIGLVDRYRPKDMVPIVSGGDE
jgi:1-acyl-sn-glycerol-3-phosphate acyltransferase